MFYFANINLFLERYSKLRNKRRPYVYKFWIFFQALLPLPLQFFITKDLKFWPNFPCSTIIPCPTSIPESRVHQIVCNIY